MPITPLTLSDVFFREQAKVGATGELSTVLNRISLAARRIASDVMNAPLRDNLGKTGDVNVQGEEVKALDLIANDIFIDTFAEMQMVGGMASEEMEDVHAYADQGGKYVLLHDPLDGSSNVDIAGSMGTIFSVHRRRSKTDGPLTKEDFLQKGVEQVAAGYVLYGPSTMFVYSVGGGVYGFTLDRSVGTFVLTHPRITIPNGTGSYAVNEANEHKWDDATRDMVRAFRTGETDCGKRSARYVGALVADFHRALIQGGIYMYPGEVAKPQGKLRLLFECAPLAFIAEQAGGQATDGRGRILELAPTELHHRCPLFIGSNGDVDEAMRRLNA